MCVYVYMLRFVLMLFCIINIGILYMSFIAFECYRQISPVKHKSNDFVY